MVAIFILKCEYNKYFVGKTDQKDFILEQHFDNVCDWTKIYRPVDVLEIYPDCGELDEDKYVKLYMGKFGIDNVRGGSYIKFKLEPDQISLIKKEIISLTTRCVECNKVGHMETDCTYYKAYKGDICYKCGRLGHVVKNCNAKSHIDGSNFNQITCYACGRRGHWKINCEQKTDRYGRPIDPSCIIM